MVVDVTEGELRQTPMSLEVVATDAAGQWSTVLSLPPKVYERGVADTEVVLHEGNNYIARVLVDLDANREPQLLSFPIRVTAWYRAMLMPTLIVVALLALIVISAVRYYLVSRQNEGFAEEEMDVV